MIVMIRPHSDVKLAKIKKLEIILKQNEIADVLAAYTVANVYSKQSVFKAKSLLPKISRRIKMPVGTMKFKEEMTPGELEWYRAKRKAALAKGRATPNA